jgi:hypothetical protein
MSENFRGFSGENDHMRNLAGGRVLFPFCASTPENRIENPSLIKRSSWSLLIRSTPHLPGVHRGDSHTTIDIATNGIIGLSLLGAEFDF